MAALKSSQTFKALEAAAYLRAGTLVEDKVKAIRLYGTADLRLTQCDISTSGPGEIVIPRSRRLSHLTAAFAK